MVCLASGFCFFNLTRPVNSGRHPRPTFEAIKQKMCAFYLNRRWLIKPILFFSPGGALIFIKFKLFNFYFASSKSNRNRIEMFKGRYRVHDWRSTTRTTNKKLSLFTLCFKERRETFLTCCDQTLFTRHSYDVILKETHGLGAKFLIFLDDAQLCWLSWLRPWKPGSIIQ